MAKIQVKKYVKRYKVSKSRPKKEYPTVSYYIYIPHSIAEKFLGREFTVKPDGDRIILEAKPLSKP